jgi:cytochrome b6-f complex iron-sulfur subunit
LDGSDVGGDLTTQSPATAPLRSRRYVLGWIVGGFGSLTAAGLVGAYRMLTPPEKLTHQTQFTVPRAGLPEVGAAPIKVEAGRFFVLRDPEGIYVFSVACTHLGDELAWRVPEGRTGRFECPSHGAVFARDGERVAGPGPRPMDLFHATFNRRGDLVVDISHVIVRERADPADALPAEQAGAAMACACRLVEGCPVLGTGRSERCWTL